ncbi:hypothetical protein NMY22_g9384 [Coprinellus aureogranulatus]|nr:hypothetical protein NMY22_g9384 [Coprinellus aureogranulatus]
MDSTTGASVLSDAAKDQDRDREDWRDLKLTLERPYKDDNGQKLPTLLDIEPDGKFIYEAQESLDDRLKSNLHRIFLERGIDFFDNPDKRFIAKLDAQKNLKEDVDEDMEKDVSEEEEGEMPTKHMTFEELIAMREELMPQLFVALGEMSQARDILNSLLSTVQPNTNALQALLGVVQPPTTGPVVATPSGPALTATIVTKQPPISSLQAFNAQIVIGSKDEALRKAADLFDTVATRLEKSQKREELYWVNALRIRRSNWRLIPSPLPRGTFISKGTDRTAKDFLVAYGLEESHAGFRRAALAHLSDVGSKNELVFANRQRNRMQITLSTTTPDGQETIATNTIPAPPESLSVEEELAWAQTEIIDQEIFSYLVKEAPAMPTVIGKVSERTIDVEAADGIELKLELVKDDEVHHGTISPICDVIYHALHVLLLRKHEFQKGVRLKAIAGFQPPPDEKGQAISPPILQPIVDFLQYNLFCERLERELNKAASGLSAAGISTNVSFDCVGETGRELVDFISDILPPISHISGEAVLTISDRHSVRFTFVAPSLLTAHLSQATIHVYSIAQLSQLLKNEIEHFLLHRILQLGQRLKGGTWLVDLDRLVARWEGCVLSFHLTFEKDLGINLSAFQLDSKTGRHLFQYSRLNSSNATLLSWVEDVINKIPA